jgi:hypothetical protein
MNRNKFRSNARMKNYDMLLCISIPLYIYFDRRKTNTEYLAILHCIKLQNNKGLRT